MISIVIPAYNEEKVLPELIQRLSSAAKDWGDSYEIVFVDDGSKDRTWDIIREQHKRHPYVRGIRFSRNFGHQSAVTAGLAHAQGDAVFVMDADLQDPPEILAKFIEKWREGYEVVYAVRMKRKESIFKKASYFLFYRMLQRLAEIDIPLDSGDFCLMDRKVLDELNRLPEKHRFVRGLRAWVGFKQYGLAYERHARQGGEPKYTLKKLIGLALNGLLSFSSFPLRLASLLGLIIAGTSFLGLIFFFLYRIFDWKLFGYSIRATPGTATIFLTVLFLGGIQLITIGIIGEYIGRIFEEVKARPTYVARDVIGFCASSDPRPASSVSEESV
ncbi:MAG: glycosyltransferase [Candidatus Auribacter fodinae]|jgi:dolichol-phosphate mannosyltransferase|uniref:Glycosyltransferase n=1 Tax=Candidatus Auribacter fodinae TaxID=2093366 RepID=A0A3A4R6T2_9BACT|nr:MAG: glycosyltransferase [Candidatus Auribacter fodinae]